MAENAGAEEYVCPNCNEPVEPEWKACPSCGVEFAGAEEEAPAPPAPAPPAPPPKPAAPPAKTSPLAAKPAPPPKAAKLAPPPKAAKEKAPAKPCAPKGAARGPAFLAPITSRFGFIGLIGLPVAVLGLGGVFAVYNWDTLFGGQSVNSIGPNQQGAVMGAVAVAGLGVFLTLLGLMLARTPRAAADLEARPAAAEAEAPVEAIVPSRPPVLVEVPEPEVERESEPALAPSPAPSRAPAAVAEAVEVEEEEEGEIELPGAPPPTPAIPVAPPPPPSPAAPPAPPKAAAPAAAQERDELEDLFGELESEVAKAEEEEVHYECPNCHGIVGEADTTCPHCGVVFEG